MDKVNQELRREIKPLPTRGSHVMQQILRLRGVKHRFAQDDTTNLCLPIVGKGFMSFLIFDGCNVNRITTLININ